MTESKIYLNVPFVEKDEAKALGARWDVDKKRWYVPSNKDVTLFAKWRTEAGVPETNPEAKSMSRSKPIPGKSGFLANTTDKAMMTYPADKNFVAYDGDEPPWD
jgi:hypothetical protein